MNSGRFLTWRAQAYWWLERPDHSARGPRLFQFALVTLILANVMAVIFETVDTFYTRWQVYFDLFEAISLSLFCVEYCARLWSVPEAPETRSRLSWFFSPGALIDLLAILPALLVFFIPLDLRIVRVMRVLRLLKLTRYSTATRLLLNVLEEEADTLMACISILAIMLILSASGAWLVEHKAQPEAFGSIPAAMWWAVATLTTVGYGDVVPITVAGKVFGSFITVIGIGMAALPAGVLASGLTDQLRQGRSDLRREFRLALEDGNICDRESAEIETLRKKLGLSHRAANVILEEVLESTRSQQPHCPNCGHEIETK